MKHSTISHYSHEATTSGFCRKKYFSFDAGCLRNQKISYKYTIKHQTTFVFCRKRKKSSKVSHLLTHHHLLTCGDKNSRRYSEEHEFKSENLYTYSEIDLKKSQMNIPNKSKSCQVYGVNRTWQWGESAGFGSQRPELTSHKYKSNQLSSLINIMIVLTIFQGRSLHLKDGIKCGAMVTKLG